MSINSIVNQYNQYAGANGSAVQSGNVEVTYEDNILTFTSDNGEYTINAANLSDYDLEMLSNQLGTDVVKEDDETKTEGDRKGELRESAEKKEVQMDKVSDEIGVIYDETLAEQEKVTKNEYLRILDVIENSVAAFLQARKNGEQVEISDLNAQITAGVDNSTYEQDIAEVFSGLDRATGKISEMSDLIREYASISDEINSIEASELEEFKSIPEAELTADEYAILQGGSFGFLCKSNLENYELKLDGHKEQFGMISAFRQLDDGIIQMYHEYAGSIGSAVQDMINQDERLQIQEPDEENKDNKNVKEKDKTNPFDNDRDKDDEEEYEKDGDIAVAA